MASLDPTTIRNRCGCRSWTMSVQSGLMQGLSWERMALILLPPVILDRGCDAPNDRCELFR